MFLRLVRIMSRCSVCTLLFCLSAASGFHVGPVFSTQATPPQRFAIFPLYLSVFSFFVPSFILSRQTGPGVVGGPSRVRLLLGHVVLGVYVRGNDLPEGALLPRARQLRPAGQDSEGVKSLVMFVISNFCCCVLSLLVFRLVRLFLQ